MTGGAGATGNAAKVQLWTIGGKGSANQQWKPVSLGNNTYKFVARHSGRCLDVPGSSTATRSHPTPGSAALRWPTRLSR